MGGVSGIEGINEEFFVDGDILLDGVDADGETAMVRVERPLVGDLRPLASR